MDSIAMLRCRCLRFAIAFVACVGASLSARGQLPLPVAVPEHSGPVGFDRDVLPMLQKHCTACHNAKLSEGGLNLETRDGVLKGGDSGPGVVPKEVAASTVWARATGSEEPLMPPEENSAGAVPMTPAQLGLLRLWIEQGAAAGESMQSQSIQWQSIPDRLQPIYSVAISPDGQWVAEGRGNVVVVHDLASGQKVAELIDPGVETVIGTATTGVDLVQSLAFSPDGRWIATGGYREVKLWRRTAPAIDRAETPLAGAAGLATVRPDAKQLAFVNAIGDVEVWDTENHQRLRTLQPEQGAITGLAFGGGRLFRSDAQGRLVAWDSESGNPSAAVETGSMLSQLVTTPDGTWIAGVDTDAHAAVWRFGGASADAPADAPAEASAEGASLLKGVEWPSLKGIEKVTAVAFASAGTLLAVGTEAGGVILIRLDDGGEVRRLDHGAPVEALGVNADGSQIATGGRDGKTRLWTVSTGAPAGIVEGDAHLHLATARAERDAARQQAVVDRSVARTPELEALVKQETEAVAKVQAVRDAAAGKLAADEKTSIDASTQVSATEMALATTRQEAETPEAAAAKVAELAKQLEVQKKAAADAEQVRIKSVADLAQHERTLATVRQAAERATAALPEHAAMLERERRRADDLRHRLTVAQQRATTAHAAIVTVAFSVDGTQVATADAHGAVRTYRAANGQPLSTFAYQAGNVAGLHFLDEQTLCAFGRGAPPDVWSLRPRWQLARTIGALAESPLSDRATAISFDPDGHALAVGSGPPSRFGEVKVFATETGELLRDVGPIHSDSVLGIAFSPDGRMLASAAADKTIRLTNVATGKVIRSLEGHSHHVLAVAWQDDGQGVASASADATVKIWNPGSGEQLRTIGGFSKEVAAVAYVGPTSQVVMAGADGQVRLYNAADGSHIRNFAAGSDFQYAVAVTPDGARLVAAGQDGILRAWSLADGTLLHEWK